jgi:antitoxin component YwqK of YwqJK toxin-antitoxin module
MKRADYDELDSPDGVTYYWLDSPGQLFTGIAYQMRPEGQLWSETQFLDGREHGPSRSWFSSGQIEAETTYYNGLTYGPDREWDEAGQLRREAFLEYGFRVREKKWDEAGRLTEEYEMPQDHPNYSLLQKFRAAYGVDPRFGPISKETKSSTEEGS